MGSRAVWILIVLASLRCLGAVEAFVASRNVPAAATRDFLARVATGGAAIGAAIGAAMLR